MAAPSGPLRHRRERRRAAVRILLFPDAAADDGLLELAVLSPRRPRDWLVLAARLVRGAREDAAMVERHRFRRLELHTARPTAHELDGDYEGTVTSLDVTVDSCALLVRVPG